MAYPPLHRKLFKSDGASPELKEEIVPHELTNGLTAPSYSVTGGGSLSHKVTTDSDGTVWSETFLATKDGKESGPIVVLGDSGQTKPGLAGSVVLKAQTSSQMNGLYIYPDGHTDLTGSGTFTAAGRVRAQGFISAAGGVTASGGVGDGDIIAARSTHTGTGNDIWFGVGASGIHRGIYDQKLGKWMLYGFDDGFVHSEFPLMIGGKAGNDSIKANGDIVSQNGWMYAGSFKTTSDRRMKKDLREIHPDLSGIKAYSYRFKANNRPAYGLVAQEVREILPDAVTESGEDKHLTLDYNAVVAALVDEVNRLKLRVAALEGSTK